jgi:DNA-binding Lrp family transcriptional regulator
VDTDGDGVGDNTDAFPENADETTDTDGDGIGDNESGVLLDQIAGSEKRLTDRIDQLQREGKTRDEALAQAIEELAGDLGTTKEDLLKAIGDSELSIREDFKDEIADLETKLSKDIKEVSEDVDTAKKDLLNKIDEAEQAGIDRDAALGGAISDLAEELGITEEALLERIGESEESLRALIGETEADLLRAISDTEAALTTEIEDVAELVGKPASEVTDADIDFVADLIAQQEAINDPETYTFTQEQLAYDVTGDGVINQADLDLLQQAATGQDVLFDLESKFAPTGIYATQQELAQQQQQAQQQTQQQIAQEAQQAKRRDLFDQLMGAADLTGQQVTVQQSPLTQIDYLYDFGSILGPQQRAGMFPTPYGTIDRPQSRNTPSLPVLPPIPRKRGGVIDTNEELLRIIGEK